MTVQPMRKPLAVILADRRGVEAPDLLTPYAILAESGAVEVKVVSATAEPVRLTEGFAWLSPQMTLAELAVRPDEPEVVIEPAMEVVEDRERADWLAARLHAGARVMSICNGAKVLAAAGLLDGRQAIVHWHSRERMRRRHPGTTWRDDLRWVADGPVITTAGISAAGPATLHLLGELVGKPAMEETARRLGMPPPDPRHDGGRFRVTPEGGRQVMANLLAFWRREKVAVPIAPGFDEIAFGAAMDGWSRTFRSRAWATGAPDVVSRRGLTVHPSPGPHARFDRTVELAQADAAVAVFEQIAGAYGGPTARFVAMQFEHPWAFAGA
jgi:putative intracellular protease/amidase